MTVYNDQYTNKTLHEVVPAFPEYVLASGLNPMLYPEGSYATKYNNKVFVYYQTLVLEACVEGGWNIVDRDLSLMLFPDFYMEEFL